MIINEQPIANGAMATPCVTVSPIVRTKKKVPINSVKYFANTVSPLEELKIVRSEINGREVVGCL